MVIRIATRASRLALWQANDIAERIRSVAPGCTVELIRVRTTGDTVRTVPLPTLGGLGVFTREVQRAVLDGRADLAVHSLKDLPTESVSGLALAAIPPRGPVYDAVVLRAEGEAIRDLSHVPHGACIATGSARRRAQLQFVRPDLQIHEIRGNVETRLQHLDNGDFDAVILAVAGLRRLGFDDRVSMELKPPEFYPAVGQGALGAECRSDDEPTRAVLSGINDLATWRAAVAERAMLSRLRVGCHAPVGAATQLLNDQLTLSAVLFSEDFRTRAEHSMVGPADDPQALGVRVADALKERCV